MELDNFNNVVPREAGFEHSRAAAFGGDSIGNFVPNAAH